MAGRRGGWYNLGAKLAVSQTPLPSAPWTMPSRRPRSLLRRARRGVRRMMSDCFGLVAEVSFVLFALTLALWCLRWATLI